MTTRDNLAHTALTNAGYNVTPYSDGGYRAQKCCSVAASKTLVGLAELALGVTWRVYLTEIVN